MSSLPSMFLPDPSPPSGKNMLGKLLMEVREEIM